MPTFLLRHYSRTGAAELRDALGLALAQALALRRQRRRDRRPRRVADAAGRSDRGRRGRSASACRGGSSCAALRAAWPDCARIDEVVGLGRGLPARRRDCRSGASWCRTRSITSSGSIGGSYRPGEGLVRDRDGVRVRCSLADHVRGASALLTAFELTGRLPYSMLAEELMAIAGARAAGRGAVASIAVRGRARALPARGAARRSRLPRRRGRSRPAPTIARDASRILAAQSPHARAGQLRPRPRAYGLALGSNVGICRRHLNLNRI